LLPVAIGRGEPVRFSESELERYARQMVLPEIGGRGQERLRAATVALVGAGGLGAPAALYLAGAGIGSLVLVDDDVVTRGNLHRQILYGEADVGRAKVDAAAERLAALNPAIQFERRRERFTAANGAAIAARADVVLDGSDSFASRSDVAAATATVGRPLVSGSVQGFEGQVTVFAPFAHEAAPCFRCLFPTDPPADVLPSCALGGILGPVAGQIGALMATEALKWLLGLGPSLVGTLLLVDGLASRTDRIALSRRDGCSGHGVTHPSVNFPETSLAPGERKQ
jgi:molybdopterin/thiamine biosynthesis adenylyltransferase